MVEAIEIAARKRTSSQVVGTVLAGAVLVLLIWGLFGDT
jgi:hypothetical protein